MSCANIFIFVPAQHLDMGISVQRKRGHEETENASSEDSETESQQNSIKLCTSVCCDTDANGPFQTTDPQHLQAAKRTRVTRKGSKKVVEQHLFKGEWYTSHKWLVLWTTSNKALCFYCRWAVKTNLLTMSKNDESAFTPVGFNNWNKAKKRFKEHEKCEAHLEAVSKAVACASGCSVKQPCQKRKRNAQKNVSHPDRKSEVFTSTKTSHSWS